MGFSVSLIRQNGDDSIIIDSLTTANSEVSDSENSLDDMEIIPSSVSEGKPCESENENHTQVEQNDNNTINNTSSTSVSQQIPCGQKRTNTNNVMLSQAQLSSSATSNLNWDYNDMLPSFAQSGKNSPTGAPMIQRANSPVRDISTGTSSVQVINSGKNESNYSNCTPLPPMNATLQSMGKQSVILIRFDKAENRNMLTNPFKLNRLIYNNTFFKNLAIKDIRINIKKNIAVVEKEQQLTENEIEMLSSITKLGDYDIQCYIPISDSYVYGVIGPIDTEVNLKELEEVINDENTAVAIKTDRCKKKDYTTGKWIDSQCIKIKFKGTELPEKLRIYRMFFKVRPFFPDVLQCYSCQRIGHTANSCKSKQRCMKCGDPHSMKTCTTEKLLCVNCKGEHTANSSLCPLIRDARKIDRIRIEQGIDYFTARGMLERECETPECNLNDNLRNVELIDVNNMRNSQ